MYIGLSHTVFFQLNKHSDEQILQSVSSNMNNVSIEMTSLVKTISLNYEDHGF